MWQTAEDFRFYLSRDNVPCERAAKKMKRREWQLRHLGAALAHEDILAGRFLSLKAPTSADHIGSTEPDRGKARVSRFCSARVGRPAPEQVARPHPSRRSVCYGIDQRSISDHARQFVLTAALLLLLRLIVLAVLRRLLEAVHHNLKSCL